MKKRIIAIVLIIITIFSLSACMSKEQKAKVEEKEKIATELMKDFLDENYNGFKIKSVNQVVNGNVFQGYDITDITKFVIKNKNISYVLYYEKETGNVWSNENYEKIVNEIKDELKKTLPLNKAYESQIFIHPQIDDSFKAVRFEDKSLKDIIKRQQDNPFEYKIDAYYYLLSENDFTPENLKLDSVFTNLTNLELTVFNSKVKLEPNALHNANDYKFNINDTIKIYDVNYQKDENKEKEYIVDYRHYDTVKCDDMYFVYNGHYFDVSVNKVDGEDIDFTQSSTYPKTEFKRTNKAYEIESENKKEFLETLSHKYTYTNTFGTETNVRENNAGELIIYKKKSNDSMEFYYDSVEKRIEEFHFTNEYASQMFYSKSYGFDRTILFLNKIKEK